MPANFPSNPTPNQQYSYLGSTWSWSGSYWQLTTSQLVTGINFTYANTAPVAPNPGDRWVDTTTMLELVYVYDGNSYQWIELSSQAPSVNFGSIAANIVPAANITYDLGTTTSRWRDLYLSGNTLYLGAATVSATGSAINLPAGSTVAGATVATSTEVSTGGGPKITNVQVTNNAWTVLDDTAVDIVGGYVKITGTNFVSGCQVIAGTTTASAVSFISSTELRVQFGAVAAGTYVLYVSNPDGGVALRVNGITFSATPAWQTASSLGEIYDAIVINLALVATGASTYAVTSGSLPPGLSLAANTGVITGTVTGVTVDTTYNFTVTATDTEFQDSPRSFSVTVTVSDPYFKLTTLLLSGSAVSANTVVKDSSTNNFNLTVSGDARASNFTPYGTGWSVYFDGSGDYLSIPNNTGFDLSSSDFTVEAWVYRTGDSGAYTEWIIGKRSISSGDGYLWSWSLGIGSSNYAVFGNYNGSITSTTAINLNTWYHIAVTSISGAYKLYVNGLLESTNAGFAIPEVNVSLTIGNYPVDNPTFTGYISNIRVIKGNGLYTANFTPATTNLTSVANTSLLTCNANRFADGSTNNFAITRNGDARVVSFNPFNITNTGVAGSMYFDGTGDYLSVVDNSAFTLANYNFCIELWIYPTASMANYANFLGQWANSTTNCAYTFRTSVSQNVQFAYTTSGNGQAGTTVDGSALVISSWNHIVVCRNGTTLSIFQNGVRTATHNISTNTISDSSRDQQIGFGTDGSAITGYMSNLRLVTGNSIYDPTLTTLAVPIQPLTAVANTQLLTLQYDQPHNNHGFLDSSSNQFLITRSGNATQGTFSPFSPGGWSNYFNNTSSIVCASNAAFAVGTGNFTVECFVNFSSTTVRNRFFCVGTSGTDGILLELNSGVLQVGIQNTYPINYTWAPIIGTWYHVAIVRTGTGANQVVLYIDGASVATGTSSASVSQNPVNIGGISWNSTWALLGYLSNVRFSNSARTITVPTSPYVSDANTLVLTCQSNRFLDQTGKTITINGSPYVQAFSPFGPTAVYNPTTHGGSAYFDGTGDDLSIATNTAFTDLPGDWTIECWFYSTSTSTQMLAGTSTFNTSGYFLELNYTAAGRVSFVPVPWSNRLESSSSVFTNYTWNHIAYVRSGTTVTIYVNGTSVVSGTRSVTSNSQPLTIGQAGNGWDGRYYFNGYISNFRIIKGTALYTTAFTPPAAPVTATTNTSLLLNFTDAAIIDSTGRNALETVADAKSSGVVTKFTGGSMYFDGTGDYLTAPSSNLYAFGTGDFTIEMWFYVTTTASAQTLIDFRPTSTDGVYPFIYISSGGGSIILDVSAGTRITGTTTISINTWYHFALARNSTSTKMFVNGTQVGTTYTDSNNYLAGANRPVIASGGYTLGSTILTGYISDLRITRGQARYTANFTAPTAPVRLK